MSLPPLTKTNLSEAKKPSLPRQEWPLLFAIFLDLVGFGMLLPDLQTRLEARGAQGWLIGTVFASYFLVQMIASPLWGKLSDRTGRKPILLVCGLLSAFSMGTYALAQSVGMILFSRILAGLGGANVVIAQAYLADTTEESARSASMGRIGAATTSGLILGPALGGLLSTQGGNALVGGVASSASALGVLWIWLGVSRVTPRPLKREKSEKGRIGLSLLGEVPSLRFLFVLASAGFFVLACLEGTFGRLIHRNLGFGPKEFGLIFGYEALLRVFVQGFLLNRISHRIGPSALLGGAYLLQGVGLALTPFMPGLLPLFIASTFFAIGTGLANPTLNTLCSEVTPEPRQGEMFGLLQSARSFGFLFGPLLGGVLFDWRPASPYLLASTVSVVVGLLAGFQFRSRRMG